ncbi:unnamed protein product [Mytilus coruscus]|uniref:Integrase catalytic domain-containing protein n=1 Tax=Mytilus coruscus TaxID=42192 RepID=A0A6J8AJ15_MYTCO|nr:unnamed protein product [Mytilus coruscus]
MFNNSREKLPPIIEKWVMYIQNVDYELVYEPGKDEQNPLDYLSRHPLPDTEIDETEQIVKQMIESEHSIVLSKKREETTKDARLQDDEEKRLGETQIKTGNTYILHIFFVHEHPKVNGEAENFMKLLNKTEQIAHMKGNHSNDAIQDMLMGFRSTPHPATGFTPYKS